MIQIDERLCTGCGSCTSVCPNGALALDGGVATWSAERCNDCGACVDACPQRAILLVEAVAPETGAMAKQPMLRAPAPVAMAPSAPLVARRSTPFWPLIGVFLRWAGTELALRLADVALEVWSRRTAGDRLSRVGGLGTVFASRPWRHRYRRRGAHKTAYRRIQVGVTPMAQGGGVRMRLCRRIYHHSKERR